MSRAARSIARCCLSSSCFSRLKASPSWYPAEVPSADAMRSISAFLAAARACVSEDLISRTEVGAVDMLASRRARSSETWDSIASSSALRDLRLMWLRGGTFWDRLTLRLRVGLGAPNTSPRPCVSVHGPGFLDRAHACEVLSGHSSPFHYGCSCHLVGGCGTDCGQHNRSYHWSKWSALMFYRCSPIDKPSSGSGESDAVEHVVL